MNAEAAPAAAAAGAAAPLVPSEAVSIAVDERLAVRLNKDGGMENMEVQGTMSLQVLSPPPSSFLLLFLLSDFVFSSLEGIANLQTTNIEGGGGSGGGAPPPLLLCCFSSFLLTYFSIF